MATPLSFIPSKIPTQTNKVEFLKLVLELLLALDISSSFLLSHSHSPPPLVLHSTSLVRVVNPPHTYFEHTYTHTYKDKGAKVAQIQENTRKISL